MQMESFARAAEWHLHLRLLAYFRGRGPAPDPGDFERVADARVLASEHLHRWLQEQADHVNGAIHGGPRASDRPCGRYLGTLGEGPTGR